MKERREPGALHTLLLEALTLKGLPRTGWQRVGVNDPESVAAHSWGVCWLVLALCPPKIDREKALAMAVVHDLAEVRVGDITPGDGISAEDKQQREKTAMAALLAPLDNSKELETLFAEYEAAQSPEAHFVRACDKLDMALSAQHYRDHQGIDTQEFIASALESISDPLLRALAGSES